ncbi:hypothetical protein [Paraburkholderia hospita]|uniref:hypothetical protein n=1 Tax=Paraburkholderia hospita TaxID=169430 RepID=UPI0009A5D38B|nr:hypothetical protein [Paraburkholderia hospita]
MTMQSVQQLDIFADSRDVMLRNDVLEPLQRRDATAAQMALERLAGDYPDDDTLPAMTVLVRELEGGSTAPFADHAALVIARRHLEDEVLPATQRVLPAQAVQSWIAPCWRSLAQRAAPLTFHGSSADSHAAPLWLLAGDAAAACAAVEGIESWWRIPAPLAWMTEARYRTCGLDATWPLLAELAWLAPGRFAALLPVLWDASLDALRRRFDADFPGTGAVDDYAWFPAWLLVVKPALAERLSEARVQHGEPASRATALLGEILRREHEGDQHELLGLRQTLSHLHPGLFDTYMATRKVQHR